MVSDDAVRGGYFGWKVAWAAFLLAAFAWGVGFYGLSVFLRTLHAERSWAIATISAAITIQYLFSAVLVAYLPEAHRRLSGALGIGSTYHGANHGGLVPLVSRLARSTMLPR